MSFDSVRPIMNGRSAGRSQSKITLDKLDESLKATKSPAEMQKNAEFHGDKLLADKQTKLTGILSDLWKVLTPQNAPEVLKVAIKALSGQGLDVRQRQIHNVFYALISIPRLKAVHNLLGHCRTTAQRGLS